MSGQLDSREFRVVWQREGFDKRTKLYQRRDAAERWCERLRGLTTPFDGLDPDDLACCSGYECGCRGMTNAQAREEHLERYSNVPPLTVGPLIESRPVGGWS